MFISPAPDLTLEPNSNIWSNYFPVVLEVIFIYSEQQKNTNLKLWYLRLGHVQQLFNIKKKDNYIKSDIEVLSNFQIIRQSPYMSKNKNTYQNNLQNSKTCNETISQTTIKEPPPPCCHRWSDIEAERTNG